MTTAMITIHRMALSPKQQELWLLQQAIFISPFPLAEYAGKGKWVTL
jgi:hypothetical protein